MRVLKSFWVLFALLSTPPADAASAKWAYEEAYTYGGDWYRSYDNTAAYLAWGESYVMMSLAAMSRATEDPRWLEELAHHIDGVLLQTDVARGVNDYRGVSDYCWQNTHYQSGGEAYCYVVHTGILGWPIIEFVRLVHAFGFEAEVFDGESLGDRASRYLEVARQLVEAHEDQWKDDGYYIFRDDASFLTYAGSDVPFNQSHTMGRMLVGLYEVTGESQYAEKVEAMAEYFLGQVRFDDGTARWNYWGGTYVDYGEDISHGAINADFVVAAHQAGLGFTDAEVLAFAETFMQHIYVDDRTFSDWVGGGSTNNASYLPQVGRWLRLTPWRAGIHAAVKDLLSESYPPPSVGGASVLLGWAHLAEFERPFCDHFFYYVDWEEKGDWKQATAYGANVLTTPSDWDEHCLVPLQVEVPRAVEVQQWDGSAYHTVARWQSSSEMVRHVPYDPTWPHAYWKDSALFQFADSYETGHGIRVAQPEAHAVTAITSTEPECDELGLPPGWAPEATGDAPLWWSLEAFPTGARVDAATGAIDWSDLSPGTHHFTLALESDWGADTQSFTCEIGGKDSGGPGGDSGTHASDSADSGEPGGDSGTHGPDSADPGGEEKGESGCGCASQSVGWSSSRWAWGLTLLFFASVRRRQAP